MRINRRELTLILAGGIIVLSVFYYLFIVSPALARQKVLTKYIAKKESDLAAMRGLKTKWDAFKSDRGEAEKSLTNRGKKFTLLSFLEGISREVGINQNIQYMKPLSASEKSENLRAAGMEMKLEGIDMSQLVNFLYKLEYSGNLLKIKRTKIQKLSKGNTQTLRVTMQIFTYRAG